MEDANDDIDHGKLLFIGSSKERFNFNTFNKPLIFISAIYNGEISLKEAEIKQRDLDKKKEDLRDYKNKAEEEEKEEINEVLMHANNMLEYGDKIIEAFRVGNVLSEHLKKLNDAAYDYVLKDVNSFIQKISESIESKLEKINLSLFEDFFGSSSPADCIKMLINTKNSDGNKIFVAEIKDRISNLKYKIKNMSETEKKNADETLDIIKKVLNYNKHAQNNIWLASKVDKGK